MADGMTVKEMTHTILNSYWESMSKKMTAMMAFESMITELNTEGCDNKGESFWFWIHFTDKRNEYIVDSAA